jgi:manganese efflux pump family protein
VELLSILLIGISLSMDAFSLSLGYGTIRISDTNVRKTALIVGLFHFLMPQLGMVFGHIIGLLITINLKYVVLIVFTILGIEMIVNGVKNIQNSILFNNVGIIIFAFTVSIDSFSAGIGVEYISDNHLLCSIVFSTTSAIFTFIGLKLGGKISKSAKNISPIIGGIILISLALLYAFK